MPLYDTDKTLYAICKCTFYVHRALSKARFSRRPKYWGRVSGKDVCVVRIILFVILLQVSPKLSFTNQPPHDLENFSFLIVKKICQRIFIRQLISQATKLESEQAWVSRFRLYGIDFLVVQRSIEFLCWASVCLVLHTRCLC